MCGASTRGKKVVESFYIRVFVRSRVYVCVSVCVCVSLCVFCSSVRFERENTEAAVAVVNYTETQRQVTFDKRKSA